MRKVVVLVLGVALSLMFAVSSFTSVSAALTYTDHQNAGGSVNINIEGHPRIVIDGFHYDYGSLGSGDVIRIWRYFNLPIGPTYLPVAIITDIPQRIDLFHLLYAAFPTSIQLINDPSDIKIVREGKSKNVHVVWNTDLVVPDEYWGPQRNILVPGITIPPGMLVIRGHGDVISGTSTTNGGVPPNTYSQTITQVTGYNGDATFVCPSWDFGGPVGVDEGTYRTDIGLDSTVVTTFG